MDSHSWISVDKQDHTFGLRPLASPGVAHRGARLEGDQLKEPARIILVEGILIYAHEQLRDMLDIKIFVDTESDVRFIRRLQRDVSERGRDVNGVVDQYLSTVRPMHNQFVEPSKRFADIIIPTGFNSVALEMVIARLEQLRAPPRVLELGPQPRLGFGRCRLGLLGRGRVVPRRVLG